MSATPDHINLRVLREGPACVIELDRPGHINAYTTEMYREIRSAVRFADADADTSVIVFRSATEVFGVGGDLGEMLGYLDSDDPDLAYRFRDDLPFQAVRACAKPTIAAIRGTCVGGGFALATACDLVVAQDGTRLGIPEVKVGLIDGLAIAGLYGHIPLPALKYLLFSGSLIDAAEALRLGLVLESVAEPDFTRRIEELVAELAANSSTAIAAYKRILRSYDRPDHLDDLMAVMTADRETADRLREFFAARRPGKERT